MRAIHLLPWPAATVVWVVLIALTGVTYSAGKLAFTGPLLVFGVLAIALLKGYLIAWHYMGLAEASPLWRAVVGGWLAVVGLLIAVAFGLART
jgi:caa(3)-type oxidase subunit IV